MKPSLDLLLLVAVLLSPQMGMAGDPALHDGRKALTPCEELRPAMTWDAPAGPDQIRAFIILLKPKSGVRLRSLKSTSINPSIGKVWVISVPKSNDIALKWLRNHNRVNQSRTWPHVRFMFGDRSMVLISNDDSVSL